MAKTKILQPGTRFDLHRYQTDTDAKSDERGETQAISGSQAL